MTMIRVFDDKPIDTTSDEIRNKVSESIANYILEHWDECVHANSFKSDGKYNMDFSITL